MEWRAFIEKGLRSSNARWLCCSPFKVFIDLEFITKLCGFNETHHFLCLAKENEAKERPPLNFGLRLPSLMLLPAADPGTRYRSNSLDPSSAVNNNAKLR